MTPNPRQDPVTAPARTPAGAYGPPAPTVPNTPAEQQQVSDAQVASGQADSTAPGSTVVGGQTLTAGTGASGKDIYGLGNAATSHVDISGLPGAIQQQILTVGRGLGIFTINTAQQLMTVLTHITDVPTVSYLQDMLYYGGQYGHTVPMSEVHSGYMDTKTIDIIKNMVVDTTKSGMGFGDYLTKLANFGKATSDIQQAAGVGKTIVGIEHPNPITMDAALKNMASQLLGHDLGPGDYVAFRAFYDNEFTQSQKATALAQARAQQTQDFASGQFGDPKTLASAYATQQQLPDTTPLYQPGQTRNAAERDQTLSQRQDQQGANTQLASDQAAAGGLVGALQDATAAQQGAVPTYDYSQTPSAISGANDAAQQFLQQRYGPQITEQSALGKYTKLIAFMKSGA